MGQKNGSEKIAGINESRSFYLEPHYGMSQISYYRKALVTEYLENGVLKGAILKSYNTNVIVLELEKEKENHTNWRVMLEHTHSSTTLKHIKSFLSYYTMLEHNMTKSQIEDKFQVKNKEFEDSKWRVRN